MLHNFPWLVCFKADALIIPLDAETGLDLSQNKLTRKLMELGGYEMQSSLYAQSSLEDRIEDLVENHFLIGKGGSLPASNIFYVCLPPWGPDSQQVACCFCPFQLRYCE